MHQDLGWACVIDSPLDTLFLMAIEQGLPELTILHGKLFSRARHFQALPGTVSFSDIRFRDYADEQRRLAYTRGSEPQADFD